MKHHHYALTLICGLVRLSAAQDLSSQPKCALPCWQDYFSQVNCSPSDLACSCAQLIGIDPSQVIAAHLLATCLEEQCDMIERERATEDDACEMLSSATQVDITGRTSVTSITRAVSTTAPHETDASTSSSDTASTTVETSSTPVSSASTSTDTPSSSSSSGLNLAAIGLGIGGLLLSS